MHIPDGTITGYPLLIYAIISLILIIILFYTSRDKLTERKLPSISLLIVAAVIVQAIELPFFVGACVHVSLITVITLYDFKTSMIVYLFVTIIQAFLFGEGGVSTLGIDILNLAFIAPVLAYGIYHLLSWINKDFAIILSAFLTITLLGVVVSVEYAIAGTFPLSYGFTFIVPIEAVVGVLEAVVTILVMRALRTIKPELVPVYTLDK